MIVLVMAYDLNILIGCLIIFESLLSVYSAWLCWVREGTGLYIEPRSQHLIDLSLKKDLRYIGYFITLPHTSHSLSHVVESHYFHVEVTSHSPRFQVVRQKR